MATASTLNPTDGEAQKEFSIILDKFALKEWTKISQELSKKIELSKKQEEAILQLEKYKGESVSLYTPEQISLQAKISDAVFTKKISEENDNSDYIKKFYRAYKDKYDFLLNLTYSEQLCISISTEEEIISNKWDMCIKDIIEEIIFKYKQITSAKEQFDEEKIDFQYATIKEKFNILFDTLYKANLFYNDDKLIVKEFYGKYITKPEAIFDLNQAEKLFLDIKKPYTKDLFSIYIKPTIEKIIQELEKKKKEAKELKDKKIQTVKEELLSILFDEKIDINKDKTKILDTLGKQDHESLVREINWQNLTSMSKKLGILGIGSLGYAGINTLRNISNKKLKIGIGLVLGVGSLGLGFKKYHENNKTIKTKIKSFEVSHPEYKGMTVAAFKKMLD